MLMDLRMPVLDGVMAIKRISQQFPQSRVLALTTFDDDDLVFDALHAGAVGLFIKRCFSRKII